MSFGEIGLEPGGLFAGFDGFIIATHLSVSGAQITLDSGFPGGDPKGLFIRLDGLSVLPKFGQTISDLEIPCAVAWVSLDRLNEIRKGLLILPCPK
jgi:hypothetical protein